MTALHRLPIELSFVAILFISGIAEAEDSATVKLPMVQHSTAVSADLVMQVPLKAGEAFRIVVHPDTTEFPNGTYPIDGAGFTDLPLIGLYRVEGLTPQQLQDTLNAAYVEFLRYPSLQIRPLMRISALGGFGRPGLYWTDPRNSLWQVIHEAGGTLREDGIEKILWERDHRVIAKDIISQYQSGQSLVQIGFLSGDRLRVTPRPKLERWDIVKGDVIPLVTTALSTVATSLSVYLTISLVRDQWIDEQRRR